MKSYNNQVILRQVKDAEARCFVVMAIESVPELGHRPLVTIYPDHDLPGAHEYIGEQPVPGEMTQNLGQALKTVDSLLAQWAQERPERPNGWEGTVIDHLMIVALRLKRGPCGTHSMFAERVVGFVRQGVLTHYNDVFQQQQSTLVG